LDDNKSYNKPVNDVARYLTDRAELNVNLRSRTHSKSFIAKTTHLTDPDFIVRMLYKDSY